MNVIVAGEQRFSSHQFTKDATDGPHVHRWPIFFDRQPVKELCKRKRKNTQKETQQTPTAMSHTTTDCSTTHTKAATLVSFCHLHDFRCTVPSCHNIFGHVFVVFFVFLFHASGQPKITNFQITIGIDQKIGRF